jgi:hypothetical protein
MRPAQPDGEKERAPFLSASGNKIARSLVLSRDSNTVGRVALQAADERMRFEQAVLPHFGAAYNLARWLTRELAEVGRGDRRPDRQVEQSSRGETADEVAAGVELIDEAVAHAGHISVLGRSCRSNAFLLDLEALKE